MQPPVDLDPETFVFAPVAAKMLGVTAPTVRRLAREGRLPARKAGKFELFSTRTVARLAEKRRAWLAGSTE